MKTEGWSTLACFGSEPVLRAAASRPRRRAATRVLGATTMQRVTLRSICTRPALSNLSTRARSARRPISSAAAPAAPAPKPKMARTAPADWAAAPQQAPAASQPAGSNVGASHLSDTTFASLPISAASKRAVAEVLRFERLTAVQAATLPGLLRGRDVLAKARTGTGKTVAFLLPAVEALASNPPRADAITVLVMSPTRELASQIALEATQLLTFHPFKAQVVYGGTNIKAERSRINGGRCDVLVATPGRLQDHIENSPGLLQKLQGVRALILDEADQLLEMGFRPAIEKILTYLPRSRQTLLFSATMPQGVRQISGLALKPDHDLVDTVGEEAPGGSATNSQVAQHYVRVPVDQTFVALRAILRAATAVPGHKVIVFFTTARLTQYGAALMAAAGFPDVLEIHSRKSQAAREKASAAFRAAPQAVLCTSDVSARGLDYPDVSLVLQVGQPSSREQYIHRLGRTARAGKAGQGVLLLAPFEEGFVRELRALPVTEASLPAVGAEDVAAVREGLCRVDDRVGEMAYQAWLGYYNSAKGVFRDKTELVAAANHFSAAVLGFAQPPALLKKTIGMMGLKGVPGLRIETDPARIQGGGRAAGGRAPGGGGGGEGRSRGSGGQGGGQFGGAPRAGGAAGGGGERRAAGGGGGGGGGGPAPMHTDGGAAGGGGDGAAGKKRRRPRGGAGRGGGGGGGVGGGGGQ